MSLELGVVKGSMNPLDNLQTENWNMTQVLTVTSSNITFAGNKAYQGVGYQYVCLALEDINHTGGTTNVISQNNTSAQAINFANNSMSPRQPPISELVYSGSSCLTVKAYFIKVYDPSIQAGT
jgi:hypothetical protein